MWGNPRGAKPYHMKSISVADAPPCRYAIPLLFVALATTNGTPRGHGLFLAKLDTVVLQRPLRLRPEVPTRT